MSAAPFRSAAFWTALRGARRALGAVAGAQTRVVVENTADADRPDEVVAVPWDALRRREPAVDPARVRVLDTEGAEVPVQVLDGDGDGVPDALLFLAALRPRQSRTYTVEAAPAAPVVARAHAVHHGPRDDLAWENDRGRVPDLRPRARRPRRARHERGRRLDQADARARRRRLVRRRRLPHRRGRGGRLLQRRPVAGRRRDGRLAGRAPVPGPQLHGPPRRRRRAAPGRRGNGSRALGRRRPDGDRDAAR